MNVDNHSRTLNNTEMATMTVGEKFMTLLKRHRLARGLSQTELASKLKLVPSTVSLWESGQTVPRAEVIPKLARILGMDAMALTRVIEPEIQATEK